MILLYTVMASAGCERCTRTEPPTQEIALFLQSSTKTLMACQKKEKILKKKHPWLTTLYTLYTTTIRSENFLFFLETPGKLGNPRWI